MCNIIHKNVHVTETGWINQFPVDNVHLVEILFLHIEKQNGRSMSNIAKSL